MKLLGFNRRQDLLEEILSLMSRDTHPEEVGEPSEKRRGVSLFLYMTQAVFELCYCPWTLEIPFLCICWYKFSHLCELVQVC